MPSSCNVGEHPAGQSGHDARRHGEQCRSLTVVSQALNDESTKGKQTTVRDVDSDVEEEYKILLRIRGGLGHLFPFPDTAHHSGAIFGDSLDGMVPFLLAKEACIDRGVRQEDENEDGPSRIDGTSDQEDLLPSGKRSGHGDVSNNPA